MEGRRALLELSVLIFLAKYDPIFVLTNHFRPNAVGLWVGKTAKFVFSEINRLFTDRQGNMKSSTAGERLIETGTNPLKKIV